ncbi:MAG TPA: hypothetical protein VGD98_22075 [Ktedonobacteraceae bacterium]
MYQSSTPPPMPPHAGRTALIYGASVGLGLGIVESGVIVYLTHNMYYNSYGLLSLPLSLLLWIVVLLVAGAVSARHTGKIMTGTLTGLWAGLIGGVLTSVTLFTMSVSSNYYDYYNYVNLMTMILTYVIFLLLFVLGIGTGLGALGGLIGQSFSNSTHIIPRRYSQGEPLQSYRQRDPLPQEQEQQEQVHYQEIHIPQHGQQD